MATENHPNRASPAIFNHTVSFVAGTPDVNGALHVASVVILSYACEQPRYDIDK
jgi:hypothetical protein